MSLVGESREGETLTLEVQHSALPSGGAVQVDPGLEAVDPTLSFKR